MMYELLAITLHFNGTMIQGNISTYKTIAACIEQANIVKNTMLHPRFKSSFYVCKSSIERTPTTAFMPNDPPPQDNWLYVVNHDPKAVPMTRGPDVHVPMTRGTTGKWLFTK